MLEYRGTRFLQMELQERLSVDDVVDSQKLTDFKVAFGLTKYDGSPAMVEDPDYGTLNAIIRTWGPKPEDNDIRELPSRQCTPEELGITEDEDLSQSRFFPISKN